MKILNFGENLKSRQNSRILAKISSLDENLGFDLVRASRAGKYSAPRLHFSRMASEIETEIGTETATETEIETEAVFGRLSSPSNFNWPGLGPDLG